MAAHLREILGRALDHAVAYREGVALGAKPLVRDYQSIRDGLMMPMPEAGQ